MLEKKMIGSDIQASPAVERSRRTGMNAGTASSFPLTPGIRSYCNGRRITSGKKQVLHSARLRDNMTLISRQQTLVLEGLL
jgi:hypothetical protein